MEAIQSQSPLKNRPQCLAGVEPLSRLDVGEIFVVGPDHKWLLRALKPVAPLLQYHLNTSLHKGVASGQHQSIAATPLPPTSTRNWRAELGWTKRAGPSIWRRRQWLGCKGKSAGLPWQQNLPHMDHVLLLTLEKICWIHHWFKGKSQVANSSFNCSFKALMNTSLPYSTETQQPVSRIPRSNPPHFGFPVLGLIIFRTQFQHHPDGETHYET